MAHAIVPRCCSDAGRAGLVRRRIHRGLHPADRRRRAGQRPNKPGSEITEDGWGVQIGYPDAPVQIEFFTEPQCPACAHLQHEAGDAIAAAVGQGRLAVTYRPLTFLDGSVTEYSAHVANALFLAAGPNTTGTGSSRRFVEDLWGHQQPEGSPGPTNDEIAAMASDNGIGAEQTGKHRRR